MEHVPNNYEFSDFVKDYKSRYDRVCMAGSIDHTIEVSDEWAKFTQRLKEKHSPEEVEKYALYHAMTGSPHDRVEIVADDLTGEDSIAHFIDELEKKYKKG